MGGGYLWSVKSNDIKEGRYYFPNTPEEIHESQKCEKTRKPQSALRRLVKRIVRCIRDPLKRSQTVYIIEPSAPPPSEAKVLTLSQDVSPQKHCSLLSRLPIEVRRQIYEELFSDQSRKWHLSWPNEVIQRKGKNRGIIKQTWSHCPCPKRYLPKSTRHWCISHQEFVLRPDHSPRIENSFLFTCRQAYIEASPILYSKIVFGFESPSTLRQFTKNISLPILHSITSLDLEWEMNCFRDPEPSPYFIKNFNINYPKPGSQYLSTNPQPQASVAANLAYKRFWDLVSTLKSLERLRVRIWTRHHEYYQPTFGMTQGFERLWLDPLVRFGGLETFCLAINEPFCGIFEKEREKMGLKLRILNSVEDPYQDYDDDDHEEDEDGNF